MKKTAFSIGLVTGALLLTGAGCSLSGSTTNDQSTNQSTTPPATETTTPPTTTGTDTSTGDFPLTAELTGTKMVKLRWEKPSDMAEGSTIRLLHSSSDNPTFPAADSNHQPYWYQPSSTQTEMNWSGIPAGTRYFRACEYKDNKCLRYSNTIKVEVK